MSTSETLAILGGRPTLDFKPQKYNSLGEEELEAATEVIKSGVLSGFLGAWHEDFYGGPKVQEFENAIAQAFRTKNAVTFNSWTSGLTSAVGAAGVGPGDEVIVSPWTMSATATSILEWNAIPVFCDIEDETFNLDPDQIEMHITQSTKAILVPDIFGHSADVDAILRIAGQHNLMVISDTAQSPGALVNDAFAGTIAHIGGYSLNYHKLLHTGEGGIAVTDDDELAERMRLIRNHAEAVVAARPVSDFGNLIGKNFRLGEIEAAIGLSQLAKLPDLVRDRQRVGRFLLDQLAGLEGLRLPITRDQYSHVFHVFPMLLDVEALGVSRSSVANALRAEGVPAVAEGYQLLHQLPIFQRRQAYGQTNLPWSLSRSGVIPNYKLGACPAAERLHSTSFMAIGTTQYALPDTDLELIVKAFRKVWDNLDRLR